MLYIKLEWLGDEMRAFPVIQKSVKQVYGEVCIRVRYQHYNLCYVVLFSAAQLNHVIEIKMRRFYVSTNRFRLRHQFSTGFLSLSLFHNKHWC